MDAPSVELEEEELERLRRRAYGPDADIAGDAAAQARLSELEAAQRRQANPAVGESAEREPAGMPVTEQESHGAPIADSEPVRLAAAAPLSRRPPWWVILGGGIAALALNAAVVVWLAQLVADGSSPIPTETGTAETLRLPLGQSRGSYAPAPDYVLAQKSDGVDADEPNDLHGILDVLGISRDDLKRYDDFPAPDLGSLNVWSGESRFGLICLFVAHPGQGIRNGFSADGCSLKGLDTIVDVQKGGNRLTRFVLRGEQVNVYVHEIGADPNAPQG